MTGKELINLFKNYTFIKLKNPQYLVYDCINRGLWYIKNLIEYDIKNISLNNYCILSSIVDEFNLPAEISNNWSIATYDTMNDIYKNKLGDLFPDIKDKIFYTKYDHFIEFPSGRLMDSYLKKAYILPFHPLNYNNFILFIKENIVIVDISDNNGKKFSKKLKEIINPGDNKKSIKTNKINPVPKITEFLKGNILIEPLAEAGKFLYGDTFPMEIVKTELEKQKKRYEELYDLYNEAISRENI